LHTDYLTINPANGVDYTSTDIYRRSLPYRQWVKAVNPNTGQELSTHAANSEISYDEPAYPLIPYGAVTGWNDPGTIARGKPTTSRRWLDSNNSYLQTHAQYDQCGSLRNLWDAKGNQSQVEYSSTYAYAYPTLTRTPVPDPSGQNGSTTAFVATTVFDFNTSLVTSSTDANNVTTRLEYNDALNRITRMVRAYGTSLQSQTSISYDDVNRIITTSSDQTSYNDNVLVSKVLYDGLGRTVETRQYEGGTNYIAVQIQYDAMGRAYKTSNPFRPWNFETAVWTTTGYDALNRVTSVTTPDSAVVTTAYSSDRVLVADQSGKKRISRTDGLGRLRDVWEVTAADSATEALSFPGFDDVVAGYRTSYSYDTLDNLTTVSQGTQPPRAFVYDSLKRLTSATNPESGTINYDYDANGNLLHKIDPRLLADNQTHVTISYVYDALNRVTSRSYNDGTPAVTYAYDSTTITNGKGRLASVSSGVSGYNYSGYDALGRATGGTQTVGSQNYSVGYTYDLAGHVLTETYPSGHTTTYAYDQAGRTTSLTGNLGDGTSRTYSTGIIYSPFGGMTKEQFGTTTPIYNKLFYNSRGQLSEIRESTSYTGPTDATWDRGAIVNWYSGQCGGASCSNTDSNGNLMRQEVLIPNSDTFAQFYSYDSLNRLQKVNESKNGALVNWQQQYSYDRYGNRTIDQTNTWGSSIPKPNFGVDTATNRLTAPAGSAMSYDAAGNLTNDTFTGEGTRTYDAENRMKQAWANNQWQTYSYDGDGRRVRRIVNGTETWHVYGLGGELLAEYAANAAASTPQKEYGHRNGQLLITADVPTSTRTNVALASAGAVATASSQYSSSYPVSAAINGDRYHLYQADGNYNVWHSASGAAKPDWLQVDFSGSKTIDEIDVVTLQDSYTSPSDPTETMTFNQYGVTAFEVQYWNGSSWATAPGGSVTGNNKVWRKFSFTAVTTSKIRVLISATADTYSRLLEVEAWGTSASLPRTNAALASAGAVATASSQYSSSYPVSAAINGDRYHLYQADGNYNVWHSASGAAKPDWLQVDFNGSKTIDEIDVVTLQDSYTNPSDPTETMTFNQYGVTAFDVQYWNGSGWATVPGGSVTGNNKVWRKFTFTAVTTSKIRVLISATADTYSRLLELEAWTASGPSAQVHWLVSDQLGTPRMVFDQTGSLANMSRHDYLPFGEELFAGTGARTPQQGYGASDNVRQKFTLKERDNETGLDYFLARYYSSTQGRFTGVDPLMASAQASLPQSWNRYSYSFNNPLAFIDPDGRRAVPDDYYADRDGQITIDETPGTTDRFYVENADGTYTLAATLQRNNAGLVQFPDNGTGFNRYPPLDAGGQDRATGENVGQGDHFLQPIAAAALFGTVNVVNSDHQLTVSLGDMSSSNGSDPWQPGQRHHDGHGHMGNRSGLDIDFRYVNNNGVSFQSPTARSDPQFSVQNNQTLYDTARSFGFTTNYQGTNRGNNGEIRGVTRAGGHNDHGHLGFNQADANIFRRTMFVTRP
jgi:RHS repeat-associated protein